MTEWVWVVAGTAALMAVSFVVGLALARILGNIDRAAARRVERRSLGSWVSD
jgi:hypothetical protein